MALSTLFMDEIIYVLSADLCCYIELNSQNTMHRPIIKVTIRVAYDQTEAAIIAKHNVYYLLTVYSFMFYQQRKIISWFWVNKIEF